MFVFRRFHLYTFLLTIGSLWLFTKLSKDILAQESLYGLDLWIYNYVTLVHTETLTQIFFFITNLFSSLNIFLLAIGLLLALLLKRKWEHAYILVFSLLGGVIVETLLKLIIQRERPLPSLITETGFSFPSGHATMSTIFLVLLIYAYKNEIKSLCWRNIFIALAVGGFFAVAISRVYLGVHWASDVIAGIALGLFWLTLLINATRVLNHFQKNKSLVTDV